MQSLRLDRSAACQECLLLPPQLVANGGRVLNVTARGRTVREARDAAYAAVDAIRAPELFCRRDIGWREIDREGGSE